MMSQNEPVQIWIVEPDGRFIEQLGPEDDQEDEDTLEDEEGSSPLVIFRDDPESICPYCQQQIKQGDLTIALTRWEEVTEDQDDEYPLYGFTRLVHVACLQHVIREQQEDEPDEDHGAD